MAIHPGPWIGIVALVLIIGSGAGMIAVLARRPGRRRS